MKSALLDPWDDAHTIAARLQLPGAELAVVLGAAAWCRKCERLRPLFDAARAAQSANDRVWLWLDLEEHAELIGRFMPEDLPFFVRWRHGVCVQAALLLDIQASAAHGLRLLKQAIPADLPNLWAGLVRGDWASR